MEHMTEAEEAELTRLTNLLTGQELVSFMADSLEDRGIAYVVWTVEDFTASIKKEFSDIPADRREEVAKLAYNLARDLLCDTRREPTIGGAIIDAWDVLRK